MTSAVNLAMTAGALAGAGAATYLWSRVPSVPDLREALRRQSPQARTGVDPETPTDGHLQDRVGAWAMNRLPERLWTTVSARELAVLQLSMASHLGKKLLMAMLGLLTPVILTLIWASLGLTPPVAVPVVACLVAAGFMYVLPDLDAKAAAARARVEFRRSLTAFVDLVALERIAGAGPRQAVEHAAAIGNSWVFQRLTEELRRSRWNGQTPWRAMEDLSIELDLPDLRDVADVMRLAGEEGTQVYGHLRARSTAMRRALMEEDRARANEASERMTIPMSMTGLIFTAIVITPALLQLLAA